MILCTDPVLASSPKKKKDVKQLETCLVLWARRFEVGATERVWVHLDFVEGFLTLGQSDKAPGICFARVERAATRACRTSVAPRSQDSAWSHRILKGLMKILEVFFVKFVMLLYGCYASWEETAAACTGYTQRPEPRLSQLS